MIEFVQAEEGALRQSQMEAEAKAERFSQQAQSLGTALEEMRVKCEEAFDRNETIICCLDPSGDTNDMNVRHTFDFNN